MHQPRNRYPEDSGRPPLPVSHPYTAFAPPPQPPAAAGPLRAGMRQSPSQPSLVEMNAPLMAAGPATFQSSAPDALRGMDRERRNSTGSLRPADIQAHVSSRYDQGNLAKNLRVKTSAGGRPQDSPNSGPQIGAAWEEPEKLMAVDFGKRTPLKTHFSVVALVLVACYFAAVGYYFYIRIATTLEAENAQYWYRCLVLTVEIMGITAMVPYALLLPVYTLGSSSRGLPADDGTVDPAVCSGGFHVRVLVPCYKEDLSVIVNTVTAAVNADIPPGCMKTVYLCDDGKDDKKRAFAASLGPNVVYVTGRQRAAGEINGKSGNLNNCLTNIIYKQYTGCVADIPLREVIVVFDADMVPKRNFFLKTLEVMWDDGTALCLTPQAFSNVNPKVDIFNNVNQQFWEYVLPGSDAWGYIACTGSNFVIRANALASVGWFPEYCITEDYALGMELKKAGYKGRYLAEYLAVGEAPEEVRNVFRQRSRWTKGHMQVFFSRQCPLFNWSLPLVHKILYTNGTWAYFCTIATTVMFTLVPFLSLAFGWNPVVFNTQFALAATLYLVSGFVVQNYFRKPSHLKSLYFASISNHILSFTYFKAVLNTLLSMSGFKDKAGFKATEKKGGGILAKLKTLGSGRMTDKDVDAAAAVDPQGRPLPVSMSWQPEEEEKEERHCCNMGDLQGILDPLVLAISLLISLAAISAGVYRMVTSPSNTNVKFQINTIGELVTSGRLEVYTLVPILWAAYNAIPPFMFFLYTINKGPFLEKMIILLQVWGFVLAAFAVAALWLAVPFNYDTSAVLKMTTPFFNAVRSGNLPLNSTAVFPFLTSSALSDSVVGGWYMKGSDYVKYSFPMGSTLAMLAWSVIEFQAGYEKAGSLNEVLSHVRWAADYIAAAHQSDGSFVAQIGNPDDYAFDAAGDFGYWGQPSGMPGNRTAIYLSSGGPAGAEVLASASAGLSAAALLFNKTDPAYAASLQNHAVGLWTMANSITNLRVSYCNLIPCVGSNSSRPWTAFPSTSVLDDMSFAAIWLYRLTGDRNYADSSERFMLQHRALEANTNDPNYWIANYNNVAHAANVLLATQLASDVYRTPVNQFLTGWMRGVPYNGLPQMAKYTAKGLAWTPGAPLPNAAMATFLGLVYANYPTSNLGSRIVSNVRCWAFGQSAYTLGGVVGKDNSFIVGYGSGYPLRPQDMEASCVKGDNSCNVDNGYITSFPNPNTLTGCLPAGPTTYGDDYPDLRTDPGSQVGAHFNAPMAGALAGLVASDISNTDCQLGNGFYQTVFLSYTPE